jgi:flavin-dependent dehydrogenase
MNIPKKCDVVVIGGGPAGSTAATLLSRKGYDVVLFDKARHPRYNVGESLIPHFWKYCDQMGAAAKIEQEGFIRKAGGTVIWGGEIRQMQFADFGYTRPALHVERDRFDHILLDHTREQGARVFEEVSVLSSDLNGGSDRKVEYRPVGARSSDRIDCRFVVDASGQSAVISRQLGLRRIDDQFRFMSVWGYFEGSRYIAADGKAYAFDRLREVPPTTFVCNIGEWGWSWHIPLRETTSVGLVIPQADLKAKAADEDLERYFLRTCRSIPYLDRLLAEATFCEGSLRVIRDYSYRPERLAGPGYFLIGDAAAFIDPIFSIGVVLGMYSAAVATWAIDRSMQEPQRTDDNQAIFASQFGARLEASRSLALPRYGYGGSDGEKVMNSIQFESSLEQELMFVVSTLTTRSENFVSMARNAGSQPVSSNKYRRLDEIVI